VSPPTRLRPSDRNAVVGQVQLQQQSHGGSVALLTVSLLGSGGFSWFTGGLCNRYDIGLVVYVISYDIGFLSNQKMENSWDLKGFELFEQWLVHD